MRVNQDFLLGGKEIEARFIDAYEDFTDFKEVQKTSESCSVGNPHTGSEFPKSLDLVFFLYIILG